MRELAKLLESAEAGRAPEDTATLALALDRYLEVTDLSPSTRATSESFIRRIIKPVLGDTRLREIGPDSLDALYAHLRKCSRVYRFTGSACLSGCPPGEGEKSRPPLRAARRRDLVAVFTAHILPAGVCLPDAAHTVPRHPRG